MTVIARDAVAVDHLVYAWPFPIGPECELSCAGDEQIVMCPSWVVGDRLGPGHHRWRTPNPSHPVAIYFVLTAPVEVSYDMQTQFLIPSSGQPVRLRATGSLQVVCNDPGLLVAQFVGLPFDGVNDGIVRSVSRSIERMLARLLIRRVVMAGTPAAASDPSQTASIVDELVSYNPAAGAVFGVDLVRIGHMMIQADDGSRPWHLVPHPQQMPPQYPQPQQMPLGTYPPNDNGPFGHTPSHPNIPMMASPLAPLPSPSSSNGNPVHAVSGEIGGNRSSSSASGPTASGSLRDTMRGPAAAPAVPTTLPSSVSGEIVPRTKSAPPGQYSRAATPLPVALDEVPLPRPIPVAPKADSGESRGSISGVGISSINTGAVAGEIPTKVPAGARVLVPGPNGLIQSATVRQLTGGYYELEVGSSGETIWVPINGVVPE